jgi:hypothetical protein
MLLSDDDDDEDELCFPGAPTGGHDAPASAVEWTEVAGKTIVSAPGAIIVYYSV